MISKYRCYLMWIMAIITLSIVGTCKVSQADNYWNTQFMDKNINERNCFLGLIVKSVFDETTNTCFKCDKPTGSFFMGIDRENNAYWSIRCANDKAYMVQMINDAEGSTTVTSCAILKLCGVHCFKKF